ncbi:MAG: hypothetical protein A2268_15835 [Candidatus Raymondbacteria bacterium RifOxyA12_full_50_37]|uniref:Flagellar protein FlgN n=1 Tax=Candidatus Raymondbacteria bacterium RIFOXYD12_FULL_49_13 TaxID=1817890 RepID=A0A1F7F5G3_UNCRA|nr:MAG: hypothetical protein A2268_15835 [Candidatus Raymondbacteria bacterium RifOxyA12_full_50_37]OGJ89221.1 MAG: hypothetical protein A2248_18730 [Candidatus Raymondbacteria bacterium RIFOXYA2_FULL_49_16]OGJ97387.1 MAG: hypothetical protein A2453_03650 [Candidatus Raymondbacteria bacterium RIFOXYC2_FULL_50_21]OGK01788.1 MAG: hypothetical protein A2487_18495 [Candidatus Raymondbacteria bacterium RifOxyC12_full_50_8]OGK01904.1 MAG: hypothetical protein A2519_05530 [Candidatus Raymondbacteria b
MHVKQDKTKDKSMKTLINAVEEKLVRLTGLYKEYMNALIIEQQFIVNARAEELNTHLIKKQALVEKIQSVEEERLEIISRIAEKTGKSIAELKLDVLAAMLEPAERDQLLAVKKGLQLVIGSVRAINNVNNQLLQDSVAYVRSTFELVTGKKEVKKGYGRNGCVASSVQVSRNLLNTKI